MTLKEQSASSPIGSPPVALPPSKAPMKVPFKIPMKLPVSLPAPMAGPPPTAPPRPSQPVARRPWNGEGDATLRSAAAPEKRAHVEVRRKRSPTPSDSSSSSSSSDDDESSSEESSDSDSSSSVSSGRTSSDLESSDDEPTLLQFAKSNGLVNEETALVEDDEEDEAPAPPPRPPIVRSFPSDVDAALQRYKERLNREENNIRIKDDNKAVSLGTSKINYIDPRIVCSWAKEHDVPIGKLFSATIQKKFPWAMGVEGFRF